NVLPAEGMTPPRREIRERHFVSAANFSVHLMHLPGESIRWKPFSHCVGIEKCLVNFFGRRSEDAVKSDRVRFCCHNIFTSSRLVGFRVPQAHFCVGGARLIIQPIPNRSSTIPNRGDQKVFVSGILIFPPSANALKARLASASLE